MSTPNSPTRRQGKGTTRAFGEEGTASGRGPLSRAMREDHAFTLIELLVVISIIGVLAGLIIGLTGLATRKSRESRVRIEMSKLINDIENYRANVGFYPPDHRVVLVGGVEKGLPSPNQLYYELAGMIYTNSSRNPSGSFQVVGGGSDEMTPNFVQNVFGSSGFANAQRRKEDLKFRAEFKGSQVKRVAVANGTFIEVLAVPVPGHAGNFMAAGSYDLQPVTGSSPVNPWLYVSTSPTNNPERFDLWAEVFINGKKIRFSNWERDPVVLE